MEATVAREGEKEEEKCREALLWARLGCLLTWPHPLGSQPPPLTSLREPQHSEVLPTAQLSSSATRAETAVDITSNSLLVIQAQ